MRYIPSRSSLPAALACLAILLCVLAVVIAVALLSTVVAAAPASAAAPHSDTSAAPGRPDWAWPLEPPPEVRRGFDPPAVRWGAGHRGVDLAAHVGQSVRSAGEGVVAYAGMVAGRGVVSVAHGALRTTYEPVSVSVHVGQQVSRGQILGRLDAGGSHCAPRACLHWGLLRGSEYLDPLALLRRGPSRLLPVWQVPTPHDLPVWQVPTPHDLPVGPVPAQRDLRSEQTAAASSVRAISAGGVAGTALTVAAVHRSRARRAHRPRT